MTKKYTQDYRLENVLGPGGKLRTVPVYRGDWYEFLAEPEKIARAKRLYLILTILDALALLFLLLFTNHMDGKWYVVIPAALSLPFYCFLCMSTWRLCTAKDLVTREHNDKLHDRMAAMTIITAVLAGLCMIGCCYHLIAAGFGPWQLAYVLVSALYMSCAVWMFLEKPALQMKKSTRKPKETVQIQ